MLFKWFRKRQQSTAETTTTSDTMKYLIAGLGNVGAEYDGTRHNIGFDVVDYLAGKFEVTFKLERHAYVGSFKHKGRTFIIIKPTTYMNLSGQAIRYWMQKEKIQASNLLVLLDDLNLAFGQLRMKGKGSAGGHNGLKNIEQILGNAQYPRLRIGIGDRFGKGKQVNFVLGRWTPEEEQDLDKIIAESAKAVLGFGTIGLARTMNQFNKNVLAPAKEKKKKPKPPKAADTADQPPQKD